MQDFRSSSSGGYWTERIGLIAIPSPCLLCPHFLEVLALEKSRYCSMMVMVMIPTTEVQRVLRWRDQSLSWTESFLSCKKKPGIRCQILQRPCRDRKENPHDGSSVPQIHFVDPGKEIERPIHKCRLQGKFIIAKESVTEELQKTHCDKEKGDTFVIAMN